MQLRNSLLKMVESISTLGFQATLTLKLILKYIFKQKSAFTTLPQKKRTPVKTIPRALAFMIQFRPK